MEISPDCIDSNMELLVGEYIDNMDDKTRKTYEIAKEHLETSFDITKSLGFKQYLKSKSKSKSKSK